MNRNDLRMVIEAGQLGALFQVQDMAYPRTAGNVTILQPSLDSPGKWEVYHSSARTVQWVEEFATEHEACSRMYELLYSEGGVAPAYIPPPPTAPVAPPPPPAMRKPDSIPPGWYPDPENVDNQRWWTGSRWAPPTAIGASSEQTSGRGSLTPPEVPSAPPSALYPPVPAASTPAPPPPPPGFAAPPVPAASTPAPPPPGFVPPAASPPANDFVTPDMLTQTTPRQGFPPETPSISVPNSSFSTPQSVSPPPVSAPFQQPENNTAGFHHNIPNAQPAHFNSPRGTITETRSFTPMILGIVSVAIFPWGLGLYLIPALVGLILGIVGWWNATREEVKVDNLRRAGVAFSAVGTVLNSLWVLLGILGFLLSSAMSGGF